MAQTQAIAWPSLIGAIVVGAAVTGIMAWRISLESIAGQSKVKRSAIKKLVLSGNIPPNQAVADYFTTRQAALEQRYQLLVKAVDAAPLTEAAKADPQLYFQEQLHEVQRTLERLAAARQIPVPEQVGFPKEIPPSDTVPRLLCQLSLIKEAAGLIIEQGVTALPSLKIEDPETVAEDGGEGPLLMRLPVRVRLTASLPQLMKLLSALEKSQPLIDLRGIRIQPVSAETSKADRADTSGQNGESPDAQQASPAPPQAPPDRLDVELLLARYLVVAPPVTDAVRTEESSSSSAKGSAMKKKKPSESKPSAKGRSKSEQDESP